MIQARLNQLSPPARELAALAATCGRAFTFELLAHASDLDEATLVRGLDELWQRRLVREQGLHAYDFSHDAIREVAYTGSGPAGRRRLHGRVAAALQQVHAHDLDAISAELAAHYQQAGAVRQAIEWHWRAAKVATRRFDFARSTNYLNTALALLDTLAPSPARNDLEFTLLFAQISNLVVVEGFTGPAMTRTFQRVYAIADQLLDERLQYLAQRELRWYSCSIGAMDKAYQHAEAQLQLALQATDRARITEAYAAMGAVCRYTGQLEQARANLERALASASGEMLGTSDATSSASSSFTQSGTWAQLALTMWLLGFPDRARQMMEFAFDSALKGWKTLRNQHRSVFRFHFVSSYARSR